MEFLDCDAKTMPSLSYTEYLEGTQSYECEDCETIIDSNRGYCSECGKPNLKHLPIFCCECRTPIEPKTDYLLDNNEVSELPQVYLLCKCSKGLWLPLVQDHLPFDNLNEGVLTVDNLIKGVHWHLCNPNYNGPQYSGQELSKKFGLTHPYKWRIENVNQTDSSYSEIQVYYCR